MKKCTKCGEVKDLELFNRNSRRRDGRQSWCKACAHARRAEWAREDTGRARKYKLKYEYGLTEEDFDRMLQDQDNKCLLCPTEFTNTLMRHIDHDHETGRVRGILCNRCNMMVGWYEAIPDHQKVIDYLEDR